MLEALRRNESFTYAKLSPEEMQTRGILGRLVGPCADFTVATRNGRKYGEDLWDKVFSDEIVNEKIKNKCLFGELGHPIDREEVDPEKIAIALNELPKKNQDGQLVACFDILNTPCGKILKSLCDYGTTIGISSRGSGDLMTDSNGDEVVDPDTYLFECFDAVLLPAVKSARLNYMTESADPKTLKLKEALKESYDKASDEDKKIMKEAFDELNINIDETAKFPRAKHEDNPNIAYLAEEADEITAEENEENTIDDIAIEDAKSEAENDVDSTEETADGELEFSTLGDLLKELKDFDKKLEVEFKPVVIDGVEYPIETVSFDDSEDGKLLIEVGYTAEERDNKEDEVEEADDETEADEQKDEAEEAEDNGVDEVVESLKDIVRQKGLLEQEIKSLKSEKTVSDTEVKELKEELNKYKAAFARTSELAGKAKQSAIEVKSLTEQLNSKEQEIAELKQKNSISLNESTEAAKAKIKSLSNQLNESAEKLSAQEQTFKGKLNESVKVAKQYKEKYTEALNKYVSFRATMLGVRPADIINKLHENYSFENIDAVCDNILTESTSFNKFNLGSSPRVKITEQKTINKSNAYDINDLSDLYELAGLTD